MIKIGILVDGQSEYHSLPLLLKKIKVKATILRPLYCAMHPHATFAQIAHIVAKKAAIFEGKGVTDLVVLLDRETGQECTPLIAFEIKRGLKKRVTGMRVSVVVKVTMFENWLIADPEVFSQLKSFKDSKHLREVIVPDKADNVNALTLLNRIASKGNFDKVSGAKVIVEKLDPGRAAENSRSFRRFLRVIQHPSYIEQSKHPRKDKPL